MRCDIMAMAYYIIIYSLIQKAWQVAGYPRNEAGDPIMFEGGMESPK